MIKWIKLTGIILAGFLLGLSGLISLYHLAYNQKIYPKVKIGDLEISNLSIDEVKKKLDEAIPTGIPMIELKFDDQSWPIELKELKYQTKETAESAYLLGRSEGILKDFKVKWQLWWKGKEVLVKYEVDQAALDEVVRLVLEQVDQPEIEPTLQLFEDGRVELNPGKNGRKVDLGGLNQIIKEKVGGLNFSSITLEAKLIEFEVSGEELARAQERAEKLKTKKLTLNYGDYFETLSGQELLDLVDFKDSFNKVKIASVSSSLAKGINRPPQNAAFRFENGRVVEFKPALRGQSLDEAGTSREIFEGLVELENDEEEKLTVLLIVGTTEPEVAIEEVNDMGIKELLGKGESSFHGSIPSREHNVALTAAKLNGVLLGPGETFSFNKTIGDVSAATGYQSAYIIKEGRTVLGDGGGVCQDSTTMFRAVLDAGLEVVSRTAHAYRVSYYEQGSPVGIDATVYEPSPDFRFRNDTPAHILIQTTVNTGTNYLKIEIYGTSDGRTANIFNTRLWDQVPPPPPLYQDDPSLPNGTVKQIDWAAWGARAAFDWKVVRANEVLHEKTFYSNYKPWQAVYLRGTGG